MTITTSPQRPIARLGKLVTASAFVAASLLTFPAGIPWMIAAWLGWHTVLVARGKAGWLPLAACAAIVVAKGTWPTFGLIGLAGVMAAAGALSFARLNMTNPARRRRAAAGGVIAVWSAWCAMLVDWHAGIHPSQAASRTTGAVVCLGDSLTTGESPEGGYPELLAEMISLPVANFGRVGIATDEALPRLDELRALRPSIVVIELGGHDFLKGRGRASAKANLEQIITTAQAAGAAVILIEIPRGFIFDPWFGLERQLARKHDVELVPDSVIRSFVLSSPFAPPGMWLGEPYLSDDGLHPNRRGARRLAERVALAIDRVHAATLASAGRLP
jgi:lysophospholipase L1-like esterase